MNNGGIKLSYLMLCHILYFHFFAACVEFGGITDTSFLSLVGFFNSNVLLAGGTVCFWKAAIQLIARCHSMFGHEKISYIAYNSHY